MNDHSYGMYASPYKRLKAYVIGFVLSILLTLAAYFLVAEHVFTSSALISVIVTLGFVQALIQLVFFLRLGLEGRPHWNLFVFLFMALVGVVIVLGSLWIIYDLDNRVMPSMNMPKSLPYQE